MNRNHRFIIILIILFVSKFNIFASDDVDSIRSNHEVIQGAFYVKPAPLPFEEEKSPTEFTTHLVF